MRKLAAVELAALMSLALWAGILTYYALLALGAPGWARIVSETGLAFAIGVFGNGIVRKHL